MKRFALIGQSIGYSRSPQIHATIAAVCARALTYELLDTPSERLAPTVARLKTAYDGFNVTKPYKLDILTYLESVDGAASKIGAVNTVVNRDGALIGYNTDAYGFETALKLANMLPSSQETVLLLGAGGAARAAIAVLGGRCRLTVCNRSVEKADALLKDMQVDAVVASADQLRGASFDLVVNCTTLGLHAEQSLPPIDCDSVKAAYDMIYAPPVTPMLEKLSAHGARTVNGLSMLVMQAVGAQELFYGETMDEETKRKILRIVEADENARSE